MTERLDDWIIGGRHDRLAGYRIGSLTPTLVSDFAHGIYAVNPWGKDRYGIGKLTPTLVSDFALETYAVNPWGLHRYKIGSLTPTLVSDFALNIHGIRRQ